MGPLKAIVLLLSGTILALPGATLAQTPAQTLPQFTFTSGSGHKVTNADLPNGRLLLFVLIDPGCDHCQRMVSNMDASSAVFNKATIYMVAFADPDQLPAFARKYAPHLKAQWLRDSQNEFIARFRPVRAPALFLYSSDKQLLDYEDNPESVFRTANSIGKAAR